MKSFTYQYKNVSCQASYVHYLKDGYDRYLVTLADGVTIRIMRLGLNPKVWIQDIKERGEYDHPHDLTQSLGEEIDAMEKITIR